MRRLAGGVSLLDGLRADVNGQSLAEQFDGGVPECVRVSPVVDAAHAVLAGDQACRGEVFEWLLDGALRGESELHGEVAGVNQAVALRDRRHDGESVFLAEHHPGEFLNSLGLGVRRHA